MHNSGNDTATWSTGVLAKATAQKGSWKCMKYTVGVSFMRKEHECCDAVIVVWNTTCYGITLCSVMYVWTDPWVKWRKNLQLKKGVCFPQKGSLCLCSRTSEWMFAVSNEGQNVCPCSRACIFSFFFFFFEWMWHVAGIIMRKAVLFSLQ